MSSKTQLVYHPNKTRFKFGGEQLEEKGKNMEVSQCREDEIRQIRANLTENRVNLE